MINTDAEKVPSATLLERLTVGSYTITRLPDGNYWVARGDGEGMSVRMEKVEDYVHTFYVREF